MKHLEHMIQEDTRSLAVAETHAPAFRSRPANENEDRVTLLLELSDYQHYEYWHSILFDARKKPENSEVLGWVVRTAGSIIGMKSENTPELKKELNAPSLCLGKTIAQSCSILLYVSKNIICNSDTDCQCAINFMANHRGHLHFLFAFLKLPKGHLLVQHVLEPSLQQQVKLAWMTW
jgi:hypothetical protein